MQRQLNTGDEQPTNLLKYAKRCQRVYQGLKNVACVTAAVKQAKEKRALTLAAKNVATSTTTTQTTSSTKPNC